MNSNIVNRKSGRKAWWPTITDMDSAKYAAMEGMGAAAFVSIVNGFVGVLILFGIKILNFDAYILVDATIFGIIAWTIYKKYSRIAATAGLAFFLIEKIDML